MKRTKTVAELRADARAAWDAGVRAVDPQRCVRRALDARPDLRPQSPGTLVVAVGKAAAGMMRGALAEAAARVPAAAATAGGAVARAIVLLPDASDEGTLPASTLVLRGGHPHPTPRGIDSTLRILEEVDRLGAGDRLLLLVSGGASALLEAPGPGLSREDLALAHRTLVASGLEIRSINLVRSCLSAVKAGRLARRAYPAETTTLAISDVDGDDPAVIGSGPTFESPLPHDAACREALEVLRASRVSLPATALRVIEQGASGAVDPAANAVPGRATDYTVVASIADAVRAARAQLLASGYRVDDAGAYLRGDTATASGLVVERLDALGAVGPCAAVLGGETTLAVTLAAPGRGGRNLDLAARIALAIQGRDGVVVAAAGTDGCDGSSRAAGAVVDGTTAARAAAAPAGCRLETALAAFDTETALEAADDLLVTGPTGTNVGDLVIALSR